MDKPGGALWSPEGAGWLQPNQRLKGTQVSRAMHLLEERVNFCWREHGSNSPCPQLGRKAAFLKVEQAIWNLSWFWQRAPQA